MFLQETQSPLDGFVCSRARFTAGERHELLGITLICEAWCKLLMILILSSFLSGLRGRKTGGVGVMKDKELKLKETEASHTLGGIHQSRRSGLVVFRGPMNLCACVSKERGDGEGVGSQVPSNTLRYINLAEVALRLVQLRGPMHLCVCMCERGAWGRRSAEETEFFLFLFCSLFFSFVPLK